MATFCAARGCLETAALSPGFASTWCVMLRATGVHSESWTWSGSSGRCCPDGAHRAGPHPPPEGGPLGEARRLRWSSHGHLNNSGSAHCLQSRTP